MTRQTTIVVIGSLRVKIFFNRLVRYLYKLCEMAREEASHQDKHCWHSGFAYWLTSLFVSIDFAILKDGEPIQKIRGE